ncbi:MAG: hypothetical protein AAB388_03040 [Patescibacteria group bacterium]
MIPKGLFYQIGILIVSIGIVLSYIKPAFTDIGEKQNQINLYQEERAKVEDVNKQLAALVGNINTLDEIDKRKLSTYMPDQVDTIAVPRDLHTIAEQAGVLFLAVSSEAAVSNTSVPVDEKAPFPHTFLVTIQGTYSQIKQFMRLLEQNDYPLEIHNLDVAVVEGGFLSADLSIVTYSHLEPEEAPVQVNR